MSIDSSGGRREANKARTRAAVIAAATTLIQSERMESITAEQVADAAGISRRTFFNYFPSVEAVFASQAQEVIEDLRQALAARPRQESLIDSAHAVIAATFTVEALAEAERMWRVVDGCPGANRYALEAHSASLVDLARDWAAVRLVDAGQDATPLRVAVLTAAAMTAYDVARRAWLAEHTGGVDDAARARFVALQHEAFEYLRPAVEATDPL